MKPPRSFGVVLASLLVASPLLAQTPATTTRFSVDTRDSKNHLLSCDSAPGVIS